MYETQIIVDVINKSLRELFGSDIVTGLSIFRVVWSEDQYEKRHGTFNDITESGIFIRQVTEVREVPKYRQWIQEKHILERLVVVPDFQQAELAGSKISYEPLQVFEDAKGNYLPPTLRVCQFIINSVLAAQAVSTMMLTGKEIRDKPSMARYTNPEGSQEGYDAVKANELAGIMEELYGEDSGLLGSTLECGSAIIVPQTYNKE